MCGKTRAPAMRDRCPVAPAALVLAVIAAAGRAPAAADPPAELIRDPEAARAVVQRAVDAYRALHTYRQTATTTWHLETGRWLEGVDKPEDRTETSALSCAAPDRFAVSRGSLSAFCDGTTLWVHDGDLHQYLQVPRQETGSVDDWIETRTSRKLSLPIAAEAMIDRPSGIDDILSDLIGFEGVRPGERNGRPGRWVVLHIRDIWYRSGERVNIEMWFDDETGFIEEMRGDFTDAYAFAMIAWQGFGDPEPVEVRSSTWVSTHGEVAVNEELAPATFVFQPGPGDRRVDVFEEPQAPRITQADRQGLVGQPAPDFSGKTLEGAELSLSSLRGRVVLLDFWATWCGPCVQAMPHIQEISARFADAPVTVLGVNRDGPGKDETVRKFLKNKGITFTQVMDRQGSTAASYRVSGIPTTVLIDQAGVVRDVSVGFLPSHKKVLIEQIDALVEGRELPAAAHEEAGEDDLLRLGAFGDQDPALLAMIGQHLPEFSATDLGGRDVTPAALRDQVALLYFWMRNSRDEERHIGSGELDLHRNIQRVVEQFAGEPFSAVGICRGMQDTDDDVKAWLENNSIAVRQVYDESGAIGDRFAVHMYPCMLLIDKAGVVQDVTTGQRPNMALALEDTVRRMLAGESLIDPKELELRKKAAEAWAERYGLRSLDRTPVEVRSAASDRLRKLDRLSGRSAGNQPKRVDLDGDGAEEIVLGGQGEPPMPAERAPEQRFELAATFTLPDGDKLDNMNRPFRAVALRIPHAYVLERTGRLHVFEVPQKASPVESQALRAIEDVGDGNDLIVRGDVLLCSRWGHLEAYSLADPAAPRHLGKFGPPKRYCASQSIVGGEHAFVIGGSGIFRYDLGNPAEPRFVAAVESDRRSSTGCVAGGYLYVGEHEAGPAGRQGITVYDVSDPARIIEVGFLPTSRGPYDLFAVSDDRLLACLDADSTIHSGPKVHGNAALFDLADPLHPRLLWEQGDCGGRAATMLSAGAGEYLVCNGDIFLLARDGLTSAAPFRGLRGARRGFASLQGSTLDGLPYHGHGDGAYAALALDSVTIVVRASQPPQ